MTMLKSRNSDKTGFNIGSFLMWFGLGAIGTAILGDHFKPNCPICNLKITKGVSRCPHCNTLLIGKKDRYWKIHLNTFLL